MKKTSKSVTLYNMAYVERLAQDRNLLLIALTAVAAYIRNSDDYDPVLVLSTLDSVRQPLPDMYAPGKDK